MRARLTRSADGVPLGLAISGATSTMTSIDAEVERMAGGARVRDRSGERTVEAADAFPLTHYPPYALVEGLYGHWHARGRPDSVPLLPYGAARFERRGQDTLRVADGPLVVERYGVHGVGWGMMTAWFDAGRRLIGAVHGDAELDRMQALRAGYEAALPLLVARSVAEYRRSGADRAGAAADAAGRLRADQCADRRRDRRAAYRVRRDRCP